MEMKQKKRRNKKYINNLDGYSTTSRPREIGDPNILLDTRFHGIIYTVYDH